MTQSDAESWAHDLTLDIGENLRNYREIKKISAQSLSDLTEELGYRVPRNSIANLENGRKSSVAIQDLLVMAKALGVPLGTLLANPFDPISTTRLTPCNPQPAIHAYAEIAPVYEKLSWTDKTVLRLPNSVKQAVEANYRYERAIWEILVHQRKLRDLEEGVEDTEVAEIWIDFSQKMIKQAENRRDQALQSLEKLGITPWTTEEEGPRDP